MCWPEMVKSPSSTLRIANWKNLRSRPEPLYWSMKKQMSKRERLSASGILIASPFLLRLTERSATRTYGKATPCVWKKTLVATFVESSPNTKVICIRKLCWRIARAKLSTFTISRNVQISKSMKVMPSVPERCSPKLLAKLLERRTSLGDYLV